MKTENTEISTGHINRMEGTGRWKARRGVPFAPHASLFILLLVLLSGCDVHDPIYETGHPDHGTITLAVDWSARGEGIGIPSSYTVQVGEYQAILSGERNTIDNLFLPDTYRTYLYNTTEAIDVTGNIARVGIADGMLNPQPGWFFTCAMNATVEKDANQEFTASMRQQVRQLTLLIEPTGDLVDCIETITASLSGVAGSYDLDIDSHNNPSSVPLAFTKGEEGKWSATVRLLGITGNEQLLSGSIAFTDGFSGSIDLSSDLSSGLSGFNDNKRTPLTLDGTVSVPYIEGSFTATVTDWKVVSETVVVN